AVVVVSVAVVVLALVLVVLAVVAVAAALAVGVGVLLVGVLLVALGGVLVTVGGVGLGVVVAVVVRGVDSRGLRGVGPAVLDHLRAVAGVAAVGVGGPAGGGQEGRQYGGGAERDLAGGGRAVPCSACRGHGSSVRGRGRSHQRGVAGAAAR